MSEGLGAGREVRETRDKPEPEDKRTKAEKESDLMKAVLKYVAERPLLQESLRGTAKAVDSAVGSVVEEMLDRGEG